jgi:hypothetical protein
MLFGSVAKDALTSYKTVTSFPLLMSAHVQKIEELIV